MQEMKLSTGELSREFFSTEEVQAGKMDRRRKQLESQGASFVRRVYWEDRSKYQPHIGKRECERRVRQMAAA
jgi:hypothetical protein